MGRGKHPLMLWLSLSLLVVPCPWAVTFTCVSQLFIHPLDRKSRRSWSSGNLLSPQFRTRTGDWPLFWGMLCLYFQMVTFLLPLSETRKDCFALYYENLVGFLKVIYPEMWGIPKTAGVSHFYTSILCASRIHQNYHTNLWFLWLLL